MRLKRVDDLTPADFAAYPVWEFALELEHVDDALVRPVTKLPVNTLTNRFVATQVHLANGETAWANLENIELNDAADTRKHLALSLFWRGKWVAYFPPHDFGTGKQTPAALACALGLEVDDVFPISYDISNCCVGDPPVVKGTIEA